MTANCLKRENPIDHVGRLKAQPLLELILPKDRALSEKHANEKEMLSARARQEGYGVFPMWRRREELHLLFGEYLLENFSSFTDEGKGGAQIMNWSISWRVQAVTKRIWRRWQEN